MIPAKLKKLSEYFQKGGVYEVLLRLTESEHLPEWLLYFNEAEILRLDLLGPGPEPHALAGYEYEQADRGALDELVACSGVITTATRRRHFEDFFDHGARCHVMKHEGRIAAYSWTFEKKYVLTFDEYRRKNIVFTLGDNVVFLGNVFVAQDHRRHGVFSHLFHHIVSQWPKDTRFYSWVEWTNNGSLQTHGSLGFTPLFRILCVTIGGMTGYWMRSPADNGWHYVPRERLGRLNLHGPDGREDLGY